MKKSKGLIYLISLFAIILWGLSYIWSDALIKQNIPVEYFIFIRGLIGGSLLLLINMIMGIDIKINRKDLHKFLLLALCEPFLYFFCEIYGLMFTGSPTYTAMIIATTPLFSIVAGILFFNEKLTKTNIIGFIFGVAGIVVMSMGPTSQSNDRFILGIILLIGAAISEVGQASCTKWLTGHYKAQVITMYQFIIGSIYFIPLFFTRGLAHFDPAVYLSWNVWSPILCLAVLCTTVCFTLWVYSIDSLGVAKACILIAMEPIVTAVASTLVGSEHLKGYQWLGIGIACLGVILSQLSPEKTLSIFRGRPSKSSNGK